MKNQYLLPSEILDIIAFYTFLEKKDTQHLCVCKHWYSCFLPSFYRHVKISLKSQLVRFIKSIKQNPQLCLYVNQLYIDNKVGLSKQDMESFSFLFPHLETLYFNPDLWKYQKAPKLNRNAWKRLSALPPLNQYQTALSLLNQYGHTLQELNLSGSLVKHLTQNNILSQLCSLTPQLKRLTLYGRDKNNITTLASAQQTHFSIQDILQIHTSLPRLESLELLDCVLSTLPPETSPVPISSQPHMKKFHIQGILSHYIWFYYLAELYPNITDLNLDARFTSAFLQMTTLRDKKTAQEGLERLAMVCSHLNKVNLGQTESILGISTESRFFEILSRHGTGLIAIENASNKDRNLVGKSALASFSSLMSCARPETTKSLHIQLWRDLGGVQNVMQTIGLNTRLTELELNCGKFSYAWSYGCDINTILKYCPQLETLLLTMARLTFAPTDKYIIAPKIKTIRLNQTHFTTDSMNMLAACCPNLENLELIQCVKDRDCLNQKVYLCLPNQHLKTLVIKHLYLRPSHYIKKSSMDMALVALQYTDRNQRQLQRQSKKSTVRWYHLYSHKNTATTNQRRLRKLEANEYQQVEDYTMEEKDWDLLEDNMVRGTYRDSSYWKQDIPYGYVYIDCKYIDHLYFNNVKI